MGAKAFNELISVLTDQAEQIQKLETLAETLVEDPQQLQRYRAILEEKARILSGIARLVTPIMRKIPPEEADPIKHTLNRFSQSATTAMRIGSPFYMSALLYPQDHQVGEPNDLELFIEQLREAEK